MFNKINRKLNSVYMKLNSRFLPSRALGYPQYIQVETTSRCNLKCKMCPNSSDEYYSSKVLKDMTVDEFSLLLNRFPFVKDIALQGLGEPTLNRQLPEMISICTARAVSTTFVTNGLLLTESLSEDLVRSGLKLLIVSVDGGSEDTFREIRGGNLGKIIGNLKGFIAVKNRIGKKTPDVRVMMVGMKANINEIPSIIDTIKYAGVRHITVKGINTSFDGKLDGEILNEKDSRLLQDYKAIALQSEVMLDIAVSAEPDFTSKRIKCRWPWIRAYVTVTGEVTPCCHIIDNKYIKLGNLFEESFETIWKGRNYSEFRTSVKNKTSLLCKNCPDY